MGALLELSHIPLQSPSRTWVDDFTAFPCGICFLVPWRVIEWPPYPFSWRNFLRSPQKTAKTSTHPSTGHAGWTIPPPDRTTLLGSLGKAEWPQPTSWGDNNNKKCPIYWNTLQGINISHLGKFGKSSTQNAIFGGICDRSLEGISIVDVYTYAP